MYTFLSSSNAAYSLMMLTWSSLMWMRISRSTWYLRWRRVGGTCGVRACNGRARQKAKARVACWLPAPTRCPHQKQAWLLHLLHSG